jgi:Ca2+-binding RTX toxin-like protein
VFVAGTGKADLVLGNGNDTIDLGPGATTIGAGTGDDVFQFINGHGGGTDVIHGWSANDQLDFQGFGGNPIASDVSSGGSTVLTLTDNTVITLVGVAHY